MKEINKDKNDETKIFIAAFLYQGRTGEKKDFFESVTSFS
jgi:hypothetical protein